MAGGKGTRITSVASDIPKPMILIDGKPVLEHEIECLRKQGFTDIILTVSHLGNVIFKMVLNSVFILNIILKKSDWEMQGPYLKSKKN